MSQRLNGVPLWTTCILKFASTCQGHSRALWSNAIPISISKPTGAMASYWNGQTLVHWCGERYFDRRSPLCSKGRTSVIFCKSSRKSIEEIRNILADLDLEEMVALQLCRMSKVDAPHYFKNELLNRYRQKGVRAIRCEKSLEIWIVQRLIDDVFPPPPRKRFGEEDEFRFTNCCDRVVCISIPGRFSDSRQCPRRRRFYGAR